MNRKNKKYNVVQQQKQTLILKMSKPRIPYALLQMTWKRKSGVMGNKKYNRKIKHKTPVAVEASR